MDVRHLQTYLAVVDTGSMAEAARRLDLAPTTIAQQMKALELEMGGRLLVRSGRTVRPTVAGSRILERARLLVRDARDLHSAASSNALPAGPLRLGSTPTALMGLLPPALSRWTRVHQGIEIYIEPGTSMFLMAKVVSGDLDAAVLVHPRFSLAKTCEWTPLREEPLILLTPARMKVTDPLATIAREPFIRYDRSVVGGKLADEYLRSRGIRPNVQFELDGIDYISKFVGQGLGISILPDWPTIGPPDTSVRRIALPTPCPVRSVGLLWLRTSARSQLAIAFGKFLAAQSAE